jgi:hypothetical protein
LLELLVGQEHSPNRLFKNLRRLLIGNKDNLFLERIFYLLRWRDLLLLWSFRNRLSEGEFYN